MYHLTPKRVGKRHSEDTCLRRKYHLTPECVGKRHYEDMSSLTKTVDPQNEWAKGIMRTCLH